MKPFIRIIGVLLLFAFLWAGGFGLYTVASMTLKPHEEDTVTDAIVVLTGGAGRIEEGLSLLANGKSKLLFITGVHPFVRPDDIKAMWAGQPPLPACCITLGYQAESTTQNVDETKAWLKDKNIQSIRLVTSNYHMIRALVEFRHAFPDLKIIPHPVTQKDIALRDKNFWILMISEYHKTLLRWARIMAGLQIETDILLNPRKAG